MKLSRAFGDRCVSVAALDDDEDDDEDDADKRGGDNDEAVS